MKSVVIFAILAIAFSQTTNTTLTATTTMPTLDSAAALMAQTTALTSMLTNSGLSDADKLIVTAEATALFTKDSTMTDGMNCISVTNPSKSACNAVTKTSSCCYLSGKINNADVKSCAPFTAKMKDLAPKMTALSVVDCSGNFFTVSMMILGLFVLLF